MDREQKKYVSDSKMSWSSIKAIIPLTFEEAPFSYQAAILYLPIVRDSEGRVRPKDRLHEGLYYRHHPVDSREERF